MSSTCIILGNGPSLKGFDLNRLTGIASLGMNAAYRYWEQIDWYPTYYACLDDQMILSHHENICDLWKAGRIEHFFLHGDFFDKHPECIGAPNTTSLNQVVPVLHERNGATQGWPLIEHPAWMMSDVRKITTGAQSARFAAYMGHDTLGIMGVDLEYVEILPEAERTDGLGLVMRETPKSNPNYFFDDYQRAGDTYNIPNPDVHQNRLHIDSFHMLANDYLANGMKTRIVNTNPNSLLQKEEVFPLCPIERLLDPPGLAAVVVPTNRHEVPAIFENFRIWNDPAYAPLTDAQMHGQGIRPLLAFVFNDARTDESDIRTAFDLHGMERYFSGLDITYLDLTGARDRYERDYNRDVGDEGFKAGPNNQFFLTMREAARFGTYVFQMETNCVPLAPGWVGAIDNAVRQAGPFWILGTRYYGVHPLEPAYVNHLNGNAIYAAGDDDFQTFLNSYWEPWTRKLVAGKDRRLAHDCILEIFSATDYQAEPQVAAMKLRARGMLRETPTILNISGAPRPRRGLAPEYQAQLAEPVPTSGAVTQPNRAAKGGHESPEQGLSPAPYLRHDGHRQWQRHRRDQSQSAAPLANRSVDAGRGPGARCLCAGPPAGRWQLCHRQGRCDPGA